MPMDQFHSAYFPGDAYGAGMGGFPQVTGTGPGFPGLPTLPGSVPSYYAPVPAQYAPIPPAPATDLVW